MDMKLEEIQESCGEEMRREALHRFGFDRGDAEELDGSSVVLGGTREGRAAVLKLSPAWFRPPRPTIGGDPGQVAASLEFVRYLGEKGLSVAKPLPSRYGKLVEVFPVADNACMVGTAVLRAHGGIFPDEDYVAFPEAALREWGRVQGQMSRLSASYSPPQGTPRLHDWSCDEYLDLEGFLPSPQPAILGLRDTFLAALGALGKEHGEYGPIHGDFHHGNFAWDGSRLTVFDFDAVHVGWFESEPAISLYNCLPMPRSRVEERRRYALDFLRTYLEGYRGERPFGLDSLLRIPFWLKYVELLSYCYWLKYSRPPLSERRMALLGVYRGRLEGGVPVVEFRDGDLETLASS